MVGQNVYTEDEVKFILQSFIDNKDNAVIVTEYEAEFGKQLTANQLRYVKNKYGKDPRYNTAMINTTMGKKKKKRKRSAEDSATKRDRTKSPPAKQPESITPSGPSLRTLVPASRRRAPIVAWRPRPAAEANAAASPTAAAAAASPADISEGYNHLLSPPDHSPSAKERKPSPSKIKIEGQELGATGWEDHEGNMAQSYVSPAVYPSPSRQPGAHQPSPSLGYDLRFQDTTIESTMQQQQQDQTQTPTQATSMFGARQRSTAYPYQQFQGQSHSRGGSAGSMYGLVQQSSPLRNVASQNFEQRQNQQNQQQQQPQQQQQIFDTSLQGPSAEPDNSMTQFDWNNITGTTEGNANGGNTEIQTSNLQSFNFSGNTGNGELHHQQQQQQHQPQNQPQIQQQLQQQQQQQQQQPSTTTFVDGGGNTGFGTVQPYPQNSTSIVSLEAAPQSQYVNKMLTIPLDVSTFPFPGYGGASAAGPSAAPLASVMPLEQQFIKREPLGLMGEGIIDPQLTMNPTAFGDGFNVPELKYDYGFSQDAQEPPTPGT